MRIVVQLDIRPAFRTVGFAVSQVSRAVNGDRVPWYLLSLSKLVTVTNTAVTSVMTYPPRGHRFSEPVQYRACLVCRFFHEDVFSGEYLIWVDVTFHLFLFSDRKSLGCASPGNLRN